MIRVTIIAPAMAVRAGLRALVSEDPNIQVIAEETGTAESSSTQPDVDVVIWSPTPAVDLEEFRLELPRIDLEESNALLLVHDNPKVIGQLARLKIRAWGVLDPEASQAELVASIHALNEGLVVVNPVWLTHAININDHPKDEAHVLTEPLTDRETEILQLLAYGLTNKQIAARLKISTHTVKFHVSSIFAKLGTTNRVETVNLGLKKGLIVL